MSKAQQDPAHLEWLVKHRGANQLLSAKLYRLLRDYPEQVGTKYFGPDAQMLIAIAFSLWRSAFLSDKTVGLKETTVDAELFLEDLLMSNTISFTQDRKAKDWTFNYYASNARYRLQDYIHSNPDSNIGPLFAPNGARTPKNRWVFLHKAFEKAVEHFENKLIRAAKNPIGSKK